MIRKINYDSFWTIFNGLHHLKTPQDDHQALLAMMIMLANNNSTVYKWSWLNFETILYATRKNASTNRWFYNTKDGEKLKREQITPYWLLLHEWEQNGWITTDSVTYDGNLGSGTSWWPLDKPKRGDITMKYIINEKAILEWGKVATDRLF